MTRYFAQNTPRAGLEHMMMSVPGFQKRGGGMMILSRFCYKPEDVDCRYCLHYRRRSCQVRTCPYIAERLKSGAIEYLDLILEYFGHIPHAGLHKRIQAVEHWSGPDQAVLHTVSVHLRSRFADRVWDDAPPGYAPAAPLWAKLVKGKWMGSHIMSDACSDCVSEQIAPVILKTLSLLLDEADTKPLEEGQVEQMNFCFHLMLGKASPKMLEVYRFLAENAERIGHLKHTPFYDGDKCTTWHISQGLGLYKVKPKEMEKIPALILTASLIRNPDTRLQALADELYERYGGSWLIPVFMKAIITQPKEQVYETYSLLLGTPKEIYLFNALGMLDYRCYPEDWTYERLGPDGMTAFIFWGHDRYGSYDTTFMFERYVELDERWLFDLAKDPEGRKPTVTWQSYNRSGVLYESYDEMFISLLPRKVENPELKRILRDYFRIRSQKKKVAKSITVYQDAAERFGD